MSIHEENQAPYVGDLHIRFENVFKIPGGWILHDQTWPKYGNFGWLPLWWLMEKAFQ